MCRVSRAASYQGAISAPVNGSEGATGVMGVRMAAGGRRSMPGGQQLWLSFFGDPTVFCSFFFRKILGLKKWIPQINHGIFPPELL